MTLQSMTGFARSQGENESISWIWEVRSVNGKGLDLRFRLPAGFESIEIPARQLTQKTVKRGNLQISLHVTHNVRNQTVSLNEGLVDELMDASGNLQKKFGGELPAISDLLGIKGVVEIGAVDDHVLVDEWAAQLLKSFETVLQSVVSDRLQEGAEIGNVLLSQVDDMEELLAQITNDPSRSPEAIRKSLKTQVERLLSGAEDLDPQRLHQEAVIVAAKADIQEEIDRLGVHIKSARDLIKRGGPAGRKLDFLAQEFNRECNTICSKSNSAAVTASGLDMKLVIDQFREQLQNME
ncbi:MAG: YicC/YloC family endoribonuclease [Pseudomonadota bacterium]